MGAWSWIARYILVVVAALLLGLGIGELAVFKQTMLGNAKLSAAVLARFLGYGGALAVFWMLGLRAAGQLRGSAGPAASLGFLVLPLATLIVLGAGYDVLLALVGPFLGAAHRQLYNWIFVLGISGCAVWLVVSLHQSAEGIVELAKTLRPHVRAPGRACAACGAQLALAAKFCAACGKAAD